MGIELTWKGSVADLMRAFLELKFGSGWYLRVTPSRRRRSVENEVLIVNVEAIVGNDSAAVRQFFLPVRCRVSHLSLQAKEERMVGFRRNEQTMKVPSVSTHFGPRAKSTWMGLQNHSNHFEIGRTVPACRVQWQSEMAESESGTM